MGREVTLEGCVEAVAWGTKGTHEWGTRATHEWVTEATHEWVVGGSYEWGAFLRCGGEDVGREGRAGAGGRGEGGNDKGSAPSQAGRADPLVREGR